ncbi:hypothetical protein TWF730_008109 [Orbilia blumenaviensis]|uniref:Uncharacterized protein n=1 Tax=Orbilia blumenaviensis TaxID=1796055 RepID=A0AAV9VA27_9PEZI
MVQCRSTSLASVAAYSLLLLLPPLLIAAQPGGDPNVAACEYLDDAFDICWRRRRLEYNDPSVAQCICNVGGIPDPLIDSAVPMCTSFLKSRGRESRATAFYSSFNGYCASYRSGSGGGTTGVITTTSAPAFRGRATCEEILEIYDRCQRSPQDLITQPEVASCICHNPAGTFTTGFDDLLPQCYSWATAPEPEFATEISSLFGFCTRFGTFTFNVTSMTSQFPPRTSTRRTIPSFSFSQIEDPASTACEQMARTANACRTGPLDPLTRLGVANCICLDPNDPKSGFGVAFETLLSRCYPYARTRSPAAASEIEKLSGYCTRFADGGKTYTITTTDTNTTRTVTDNVFVSSTGPPVETNPATNVAGRYKVDLITSLLFSTAMAIVGLFL